MVSFFKGATNVKINGGEFLTVNGDYTVFDNSRHTHNVNSFNTHNTTTNGSFNKYSTTSHGQNEYHQGRQGTGSPEAPYPSRNIPPSTQPNPAYLSNQAPPGSTLHGEDSCLTDNTTHENVHNDHSIWNNVPLSEKDNIKKPNVGPQAGQRHLNDLNLGNNTSPYHANRANYGSGMGDIHINHGRSAPYNQNFGNQTNYYGDGYNRAGTATSASRANYNYNPAYGIRNLYNASFSPGQVQAMTPSMQSNFSELMADVIQETAPNTFKDKKKKRNTRSDEMDEDSDSESTNSNSGEETTASRPAYNDFLYQHGMATLEMKDASDHPSFSRVKSDPQLAMPSHSMTGAMSNLAPPRPDSAPSLQPNKPDGYVIGQATQDPLSSSGQYPSYQSHASGSSMVPAAHHMMRNIVGSPTITGNVTNQVINGPYTKHDNRHQIYNVNSGNTHHTSFNNAFNDNSHTSYISSAADDDDDDDDDDDNE